MIERLDLTLITAGLFLMFLGLVFVASIGSSIDGGNSGLVVRQGAFVALGIGLIAILLMIPLRVWQRCYPILFGCAVALAALVLIPAIGVERNGATRWIDLGFFTVQPSEVCRLLLVGAMAGFLAMYPNRVRTNIAVASLPVLGMSVVLFLIYLEPDYGTVALLGATAVGLLFAAGVRMWILAVLGSGAVAGLIFLLTRESYRVERLVSFLNPFDDPFGSGYQLSQSLIAFGRAGPQGLGLGDGVQKLNYLPEAHNDFIYAVITEETGLLGAIGLIALMCVLVMRLLQIGKRALESELLFAGYVAYGSGIMLAMQFAVNVGVAVGILPTKGLTFPFVSFGGNSLLVCCALIGLASRASYETSIKSSAQRALK
ncbi:MAG: cell division protein FtsW [Pseudomonadales bacterium]|nr:cell division protein FtsW [Pseudomonadales bacterium]